MRIYIPSKPHPFGMEEYVEAAPDGLILDLHLFQGADKTYSTLPDEVKLMGKGACAVVKCLETFPGDTRVYMDRYFSSEALFNYLSGKGIQALGL